jgi:flagellar basal-body rod protein FlgB
MKVTDQIFDTTTNGLATALNFRLLKQNIHSANTANANTPDYKALTIDFEQALHDAIDPHENNVLRTDGPGHFNNGAVPPDSSSPDVYENPDAVINQSGNSVSMEREMAELAQNRILYNAAVELINRKFGMMKYAIQEGNK